MDKYSALVFKIGETSAGDILYLVDSFPESLFDELDQNYKQPISFLVNDAFSKYQTPDQRIVYCAPLCSPGIMRLLIKDGMEIPSVDSLQTSYNFNFLINKKKINRYLLVKLVEWFGLVDNCRYTWSGDGSTTDMSDIIREMDRLDCSWLTEEFKFFMLGSTTISTNWIDYPHKDITESNLGSHGLRAYPWNNGIKDIVSGSAVSLISETVDFHRASIFTEKTHYSVIGQTFPIWIGGYGQAAEWKRLGFDIFEDVIDHSYQYCDTLIERCYRAFADNLHILSNLDLAQQLRLQHADRLQANQKLLQTDHLLDQCRQIMSTWPAEASDALAKYLRPQVMPYL